MINTEPSLRMISIDELILDDRLQTRAAAYPDVIEDYAAAMERGDEFPAIDVYVTDSGNFVTDGFQRTEAAKKVGFQQILAKTHQGTFRDAILAAMGNDNKKHGLRLTAADKRKIALTMLKDEEWRVWTDSYIANHIGVSHTFIGKLRRELEGKGEIEEISTRKTMRNGEEIEMEVSGIGSGRPETAAEIMANGTIHDMPDSLRGGALTDGSPHSNGKVESDDGYDGPLDFDVTAKEAGVKPMPQAPDPGPESWLNQAPSIMDARLEVTGVRMVSGEINFGNGRTLQSWPEVLEIKGVATLSFVSSSDNEDEATTTAIYSA